MELANKSGARYALILGDDEIAAGEYSLKNMQSGEQRRVSREELFHNDKRQRGIEAKCTSIELTHAANSEARTPEATVRLSGWLRNRRDHGGVYFIDLADHYGVTQLVIEPGTAFYELLSGLPKETVIRVDGKVVAREAGASIPPWRRAKSKSASRTPNCWAPPSLCRSASFRKLPVPEDMRLTYRFLDLRKSKMHANILLRSKIISSIRRRMVELGFVEYQTPTLTASSPEGARDFLVPSRRHPGKFYALPQAPQMFKQLIMVSGFDRYFQIAPCYRDEDARADRSPGEFYQLDLEMSFVTQDDVFAAVEALLTGLFAEFAPDRPIDARALPAHRLCRRHAEIWLRQTRSAQSARDSRSECDLQRVALSAPSPARPCAPFDMPADGG